MRHAFEMPEYSQQLPLMEISHSTACTAPQQSKEVFTMGTAVRNETANAYFSRRVSERICAKACATQVPCLPWSSGSGNDVESTILQQQQMQHEKTQLKPKRLKKYGHGILQTSRSPWRPGRCGCGWLWLWLGVAVTAAVAAMAAVAAVTVRSGLDQYALPPVLANLIAL